MPATYDTLPQPREVDVLRHGRVILVLQNAIEGDILAEDGVVIGFAGEALRTGQMIEDGGNGLFYVR
jgi:hypothetical protein